MAPILVRGAAKKRSESSLKIRLLPLETRADGDPEKRLSPALSPLDLTHAQPETLRPDPSRARVWRRGGWGKTKGTLRTLLFGG